MDLTLTARNSSSLTEPAGGRVVPVILCGGAGSRLWPYSREARPKPFLPLVDGETTFTATLKRVSDRSLFAAPVVVANEDHRFLVAEEVRELGVEATIILEPERRDSAAAVAVAAAFVAARDPDAVVLILAADHVVRDVAGFHDAVSAALAAARAGAIVTFGITPTNPATAYGYIRRGSALPEAESVSAVSAFVEKPDEETAQRYLDDGYVWNSGNFMMRAAAGLAEIERLAPEVAVAARVAVETAKTDIDFLRLDGEAFGRAPKVSFDYAVMEKTDKAAVIAATFDWSDLGTWESIWDAGRPDDSGNVVVGDAVLEAVNGSYVNADGPVVGVVGVDNVVVVATEDAVLVTDRSRSGEVKQLVARLREAYPDTVASHIRVYRPWGYYQSIDKGARYQVKRIVVKPGSRLSLQNHFHRSEHWVVVTGVARVTVDETVRLVGENESVYIPRGAVHRLDNPGKIPVELIEVQSGSYLGEDDIVRLEDDYNRK